eukprot:CAMPEP_0206585136 /NCGR_PEP_ID=MMETSP0325_2-20121206/36221_1 /ASSEMBLY_ACC=CAM_ASM_000347 /TAXON_ID=2866 /ORGANISM="Crypthecodinium cohnii, Strain Seligo" /LENGTH=441 /DNA_ID=CAMNT_0054092593 /DNA_START=106 /DNA_END=1431 /DNA_ORIENTATION=+
MAGMMQPPPTPGAVPSTGMMPPVNGFSAPYSGGTMPMPPMPQQMPQQMPQMLMPMPMPGQAPQVGARPLFPPPGGPGHPQHQPLPQQSMTMATSMPLPFQQMPAPHLQPPPQPFGAPGGPAAPVPSQMVGGFQPGMPLGSTGLWPGAPAPTQSVQMGPGQVATTVHQPVPAPRSHPSNFRPGDQVRMKGISSSSPYFGKVFLVESNEYGSGTIKIKAPGSETLMIMPPSYLELAEGPPVDPAAAVMSQVSGPSPTWLTRDTTGPGQDAGGKDGTGRGLKVGDWVRLRSQSNYDGRVFTVESGDVGDGRVRIVLQLGQGTTSRMAIEPEHLELVASTAPPAAGSRAAAAAAATSAAATGVSVEAASSPSNAAAAAAQIISNAATAASSTAADMPTLPCGVPVPPTNCTAEAFATFAGHPPPATQGYYDDNSAAAAFPQPEMS